MAASVRRMGATEHVELIEDDEPASRGRGASRTASRPPSHARQTDGASPAQVSAHEATTPALAPPGDDDPRAGISPRMRRARWIALGTVVLLVLGLVGTQLVVDARERARVARYADVPGVLAPLRPDMQALWTEEPPDTANPYGWVQRTAVGRVLITGAPQDDDTVLLTGSDPDTGAPVWSQPLVVPGAAASAPGTAPYSQCVDLRLLRGARSGGIASADPEARDLAYCTVSSTSISVDLEVEESTYTQLQAGFSAVLMLDATTGEVLQRTDLPFDTTVSLLSDGYVTSTPDVALDPSWTSAADVLAGATTLRRYRWGSDEPVWSIRSDPFVATNGRYVSASSNGRWAAVTVDAQSWLVDDADGTVLDSWSQGDDQWISAWTLPEGGALLSAMDLDGSRDTVLVTPDGTRRPLGSSSVLAAYPDDGSASGLLLVSEGSPRDSAGALAAVDARTGEKVWTSKAQAAWSMVVLDGVVYGLTSGSLWAVDASDGSVLWRTNVKPADQLLTDGSVLVTVRGARLDAYDRADGSRSWSATVVGDEDGPQLVPLTDGASPSPATGTTTDVDRRWGPSAGVNVTVAGRHLAAESPTGGFVVFG